MDSEQRRHEILLVAAKVFSEKGYHAAGVADIIEAAGVARGMFYRYFDNKLSIFEAILNDFLNVLHREVRHIEISDPSRSPLRQLHEQLEGVFGRLYENPHLTHVLLDQAIGADPGIDARLAGFYKSLLEMIEGSLRNGIEMGFLRPLRTGVAARSIVGAIKELMRDVAHGRPQYSIDVLIGSLLDLFLRGLVADPSAVAAAEPPRGPRVSAKV